MVNNSGSIPPHGPGPAGPTPPDKAEKKEKPNGTFQFAKSHEFLHMTFDPKDWNKLMNIFLQSMSTFINKTMQKMTKKLKKDWARGEGKNVDD